MNPIVSMLISTLLRLLTPDLMKKFVDMLLDFVENYVEGSKSTVDDAIVLPICAAIRAGLNVPDND